MQRIFADNNSCTKLFIFLHKEYRKNEQKETVQSFLI